MLILLLHNSELDNVIPTVDDNNPLYGPVIPAALYLKSLRGRFNKSRWPHHRLDFFQSFAAHWSSRLASRTQMMMIPLSAQ